MQSSRSWSHQPMALFSARHIPQKHNGESYQPLLKFLRLGSATWSAPSRTASCPPGRRQATAWAVPSFPLFPRQGGFVACGDGGLGDQRRGHVQKAGKGVFFLPYPEKSFSRTPFASPEGQFLGAIPCRFCLTGAREIARRRGAAETCNRRKRLSWREKSLFPSEGWEGLKSCRARTRT